MRDRMNQFLSGNLRVPVYLYLAVPIALLVGCWEVWHPALPGRIALMLVPVLMAAADGGMRCGVLTAVVCAATYVTTAWTVTWSSDSAPIDPFQVILQGSWGVVVVGFGAWLGRCFDLSRHRAAQLQERCDMYERSIYQLYKDSDEASAEADRDRTRRQQEESHRLDFSKLLLNIQHIGRELSSNLEMSAVFRLVTDAAKKLLKAAVPRLFLLDEQTGELVEHTPESSGRRYPSDGGMLGWVVRNGQIITADDVDKNHTLADLRDQDPVPWKACAPLLVGQRVLGVLGIDSVEQRVQEFDRLLYIVANFSAVAVNNGQLFERVQAMARRDGLTGLLNHATFQSRLAELHAEAGRTGQPLAVVLSDVDHFKQFNDRHGHQAGDHVLRSVARLWQRLIPQAAIAARYGGEEFVCVYPATAIEAAAQHAEELRFALEQEVLEYEGAELHVTASFGLAVFPDHAGSPAALIREADAALYAAKRAGRNRVCLAPERPDPGPTRVAAQLAPAS